MPRPGQRSIAQCRSLNNQNRVLGVPYFCYSIIYPKTLFEHLCSSRGQLSGEDFFREGRPLECATFAAG